MTVCRCCNSEFVPTRSPPPVQVYCAACRASGADTRFRARAWCRAHPGAARDRQRAKYLADPGKFRSKEATRRAGRSVEDHERAKAYARVWHSQHRAKARNYILMHKYGLTHAAYDALLLSQGSTCAICRRPPLAGKPLCVDHDHASGKVRALLCHHCNTVAGHAETAGVPLLAVHAYLLHHSSPHTEAQPCPASS
jgi:hypothetical protein